MKYSLNGAWVAAANQEPQTGGKSFYPALSMIGSLDMIIPKADWRFEPPSTDYVAWADSGSFRKAFMKVDSIGDCPSSVQSGRKCLPDCNEGFIRSEPMS